MHSERSHVLMDEPFMVGDFSPENYDKKFRGKVRLRIVHLQIIVLLRTIIDSERNLFNISCLFTTIFSIDELACKSATSSHKFEFVSLIYR